MLAKFTKFEENSPSLRKLTRSWELKPVLEFTNFHKNAHLSKNLLSSTEFTSFEWNSPGFRKIHNVLEIHQKEGAKHSIST